MCISKQESVNQRPAKCFNSHIQSATTSKAGGMKMAPGRGRGHLRWWPLIFKFFFNLYFIGSVGFDDHLTDSSLASILFASASFGGGGCSSSAYQQIVKNMKKFFSISIHKPPASIRFAPIKHALAVTVEPFKFSSRQGGVAYELSYR